MKKILTILTLMILIIPIYTDACEFHYLIPNFSYDKIVYSDVYNYTLDEEDVIVTEDEVYDKGYIQILVLDDYVFVASYSSTGLYNIKAKDISTVFQSSESDDIIIIEMKDSTFKVIYVKDQSSSDNLLEMEPEGYFYLRKKNYEDIEPIYTSQNYLNHKDEYSNIVILLEERDSQFVENETESETENETYNESENNEGTIVEEDEVNDVLSQEDKDFNKLNTTTIVIILLVILVLCGFIYLFRK